MKITVKKILAACMILVSASFVFGKENQKKTKKPVRVKIVEMVEDEGAFQAKNINVRVGPVKYLMKGVVGSCELYAVDSKGISTPLFSPYDEFTASFYDLKIGKKIYRLNDSAGVVVGARKSDLGGQMVYVLPKKARVFIKYERIDHDDSIDSEIIKVTAVVKNRGKKTDVYSLKSVMDTVLGEKTGPHFSSSQALAVNTEKSFRSNDGLEWLSSSDGSTGIQFLLKGADITVPELTVVSNKDFLSLPNWVPNIGIERNFDSVLSYNNSALCLIWPTVTLEPEQEAKFCYYIAVSTDGKALDGEKYIAWYEDTFDSEEVDNKYSVKKFEDIYQAALEKYQLGEYQAAYDLVMELWADPEQRNERLKELKEAIEKELADKKEEEPETPFYDYEEDLPPSASEEPEPAPEPVPEVKFDINSISSEQLNPSYVQGLIDRINSLESDSGDIDRNEILKLHAELDAILERLRQ